MPEKVYPESGLANEFPSLAPSPEEVKQSWWGGQGIRLCPWMIASVLMLPSYALCCKRRPWTLESDFWETTIRRALRTDSAHPNAREDESCWAVWVLLQSGRCAAGLERWWQLREGKKFPAREWLLRSLILGPCLVLHSLCSRYLASSRSRSLCSSASLAVNGMRLLRMYTPGSACETKRLNYWNSWEIILRCETRWLTAHFS